MSRRNRPTRTRSPQHRQTRARLWAGGAAALGAGVLIVGPITASAQDDDDGWVSDALSGLVDDGTITQQQADAVDDALEAARPDPVFAPRGDHGRGGPWRGVGGPIALDAAATAIGIDQDALRTALRDGQTIAEVAAEHDVAVQSVIDAMVAAAKVRIDDAVADGRLEATAEAGRLAEVTARITQLVNEGFPAPGERPHDGDHRRRGPADDDAPPTTGPVTTVPSDTVPSTTTN